MSFLEYGHLLKKRNAKAILSILLKAKLAEKKIVMWKIFGKNKLSLEIKIRRIKKVGNEFTIYWSENDSLKINQILSGSELANLFIPLDSILFQAKIKSYIGDSEVLLILSEEYAQLERRKYSRIKVKDSHLGKIKFKKKFNYNSYLKNQIFERFCLDLSQGGVSFFVNKSELKYFSIRDEIQDIELFLEGIYFNQINAKVVSIIEISPNDYNHLLYKGWKICLKFDKLSLTVDENIKLFVFKYLKIDQPGALTSD